MKKWGMKDQGRFVDIDTITGVNSGEEVRKNSVKVECLWWCGDWQDGWGGG